MIDSSAYSHRSLADCVIRFCTSLFSIWTLPPFDRSRRNRTQTHKHVGGRPQALTVTGPYSARQPFHARGGERTPTGARRGPSRAHLSPRQRPRSSPRPPSACPVHSNALCARGRGLEGDCGAAPARAAQSGPEEGDRASRLTPAPWAGGVGLGKR